MADLGIEGKLENINKPGDLFTQPGIAIINGDDGRNYGTVELMVGTLPKDKYNIAKENAIRKSQGTRPENGELETEKNVSSRE